jgi:protoporphyrinogen oxidase
MGGKGAIIIGAGPAGLTAALELLRRSDIHPIVLESTGEVGGISRTVNYHGNRIDIGGHRFFSKSKRVTEWWTEIFPIQGLPSSEEIFLGSDTTKKYSGTKTGPDPEKTDGVMLLRNRLSRIFSFGKLFDYPISLNLTTARRLGFIRLLKIVSTYAYSRLVPINPECSLEDFLVNRFGRELYKTFFKDYSEKVWGVGCTKISPDWGAQRVKGLSIAKAVLHALRKIASPYTRSRRGCKVETSLIEQFMYPKYGPGQFWQEVAKRIEQMGGAILFNQRVVSLTAETGRIVSVEVDSSEGRKEFAADYFISTMPIRELISGMRTVVPSEVQSVADGLIYRDFITVGLLLRKMKIRNDRPTKTLNDIVPDNWIYVQDKNVKLGRVQIFNNWSPYMVGDRDKIWVGLEYFCTEGDALWSLPDRSLIELAVHELANINLVDRKDVLDGCVIKVPKTYPAYFGTFDRFETVRNYIDQFKNLYLVGRNGMHRYNNMDHSMLTAMVAVDNIIGGVDTKDNIWAVNTEDVYQEK